MKVSSAVQLSNTPGQRNKLVASPNIHSKFSPSVTISKSQQASTSLFCLEDRESPKKLRKSIFNEESKNLTEELTLSSPIQNKTTQYVKVNRKERIQNKESSSKIKIYSDLPVVPAVKYSNSTIDSNLSEVDEDNITEGYLYKIGEQKELKKIWFKLVHRDLYCKII